MKYTVVFFALAAVAMGELSKSDPRSCEHPEGSDEKKMLTFFPLHVAKVPRSRLTARQDGAPKVQGAAMSLADGSVVTFDSTKVYKAASEDGI